MSKDVDFFFLGKHMGESVSNKCGKNLLDSLKESAIEAVKTSPKRVVQKCQKRLVT